MRRSIRLSDLAHIPTPPHRTYTAAEMEAARAAMCERGLRFDNATGVLFDRNGWISRPSNPSDHTPHESEAELLRWAFGNNIANAASRVRRGFPAFEK